MENDETAKNPEKLDAFQLMKQRRKNQEETNLARKKTKGDKNVESIAITTNRDFFKSNRFKEKQPLKEMDQVVDLVMIEPSVHITLSDPPKINEIDDDIQKEQHVAVSNDHCEMIESVPRIVDLDSTIKPARPSREAKMKAIKKQSNLIILADEQINKDMFGKGDCDFVDCKIVGESSRNPPPKKNPFFLSKQERKMHILAEKTFQLQQESKTRSLISNQVSQGKKINPFFNERPVAQARDLEKWPIVEAEWPSGANIHVSKSIFQPAIPDYKLPLKTCRHYIFEDESFIPPFKKEILNENSIFTAKSIRDFNSIRDFITASTLPESYLESQPVGQSSELWASSWYDLPKNPHRKMMGEISDWIQSWKPISTEHLESSLKLVKKRKNDDDGFTCDYSDDECYNQDIISPIVVIQGPTGVGKSSIVYRICRDTNHQVLELNCSQKRTGKEVLACIAEGSRMKTANGAGIVFLIDDVDILFEDEKGFWTALQELVFSGKFPVVITCTGSVFLMLEYPFNKSNSFLSSQLRELVGYSKHYQMDNLNEIEMGQLLTVSAFTNGYLLHKEVVGHLRCPNAKQSLNYLQFCCSGTGILSKQSWLLIQQGDCREYCIINDVETTLDIHDFKSNLDVITAGGKNLKDCPIDEPQPSKDFDHFTALIREELSNPTANEDERHDPNETNHTVLLQDMMWDWRFDWTTQKRSTLVEYLPYLSVICRYDYLYSMNNTQRSRRNTSSKR